MTSPEPENLARIGKLKREPPSDEEIAGCCAPPKKGWTMRGAVICPTPAGSISRTTADKAYRNARHNSDKQNARIEHDKALARVTTAVLRDDTELFKQFMDNESFRRWLTDTVLRLTYDAAPAGA